MSTVVPQKFPLDLPARQDIALTVPLEKAYRDANRAPARAVRAEFPFGGEGWIITKYEDVKEVLSDPRFGLEIVKTLGDHPRIRQIELGPPFPPSFNEYDGPKHAEKRQMLMKHLTVKRVRALIPATEAIVAAQLDEMETVGNPVDVAEHFARLVPVLVFGHLLGIPREEHPRFLGEAQQFGNARASSPEEAAKGLLVLKAYFKELVARRRENPGDDLISALIADTETLGRWTESELDAIGMVLLMAGHDATAAMLGGTLEWLSHGPELYARLRADPDSFPRAFEEFLRFIPAGLAGTRTRIALEDVDLDGVTIRKGESVLAIVHAANFDDAVYPDPDRLDVDRPVGEPHVAFGHGPHACVGQQLARMEIQVAVKAVLARYPSFTNTDTDPDWATRRLLRGPASVNVRWTREEDR